MYTDPQRPSSLPSANPPTTPLWMVVLGWIVSLLPVVALCGSAVFKLTMRPGDSLGPLAWFTSSMHGLAIIELAGAALFLFPRTAVLGAVLLTGYMGGAIAAHVRIGEPFLPPIIIASLLWLGLVLRDARLRLLLPWRSPATSAQGGFLAALGKSFLVVAALVLLIVALVNASPAEYSVSRSATVDAPAAKVFAVMNDFEKFNDWSPWKKLDPNASTTVGGAKHGNGATFEWSGANAGSGKMTIVDSKPNEHIKIKLEFSKPFEATCATEYTFKADGDKTIVTWSMSGERDFLQKSFAAVMDMQKMLGAQFDEGLSNLGHVVERKK